MPDTVTPEVRSALMLKVRGKHTRLEDRFRKMLWAAGIRGYRCHPRSVYGVPDLAWRNLRVAVFIDSAWWHGHPSRWQPGRLPPRWDEKIARNRARDQVVNDRLSQEGWTVVRVWDFEIDREPRGVIAVVASAVNASRSLGLRSGASIHPPDSPTSP